MLLGILLIGAHFPAFSVSRLPELGVLADEVTVSGISSGGFAAVQFTVARSATVRGVGVVAAGPYACVRLEPWRIESVCLRGHPDAAESVLAAESAAALGLIDATRNLRSIRAWVLADGADPVVARAVVESARDFLRHYAGDAVRYQVLEGAGHSMPTLDHGSPCGATAQEFLNACGFDAAGRMLDDLVGGTPAAAAAPGRLLRFDQLEFVGWWRRLSGSASLDDSGFVYVPSGCERGGCRLHVALHGCKQGARYVGEDYARFAGYNAWADSHRLVVLYPQVAPSLPSFWMPWRALNPDGCWDWWGYSGPDYAARSGAQNAAIAAMVERLAARVR